MKPPHLGKGRQPLYEPTRRAVTRSFGLNGDFTHAGSNSTRTTASFSEALAQSMPEVYTAKYATDADDAVFLDGDILSAGTG